MLAGRAEIGQRARQCACGGIERLRGAGQDDGVGDEFAVLLEGEVDHRAAIGLHRGAMMLGVGGGAGRAGGQT